MPRSLANLDLNLIVTLDALLAEQNVTRAATRLGVTQPAVSAALGRLRRHFGDELLSRVGNRYELTPLALQLQGHTTTAIASVQRVFDTTPDFDPASVEREFTLVMSDYAAAVLGQHLARVLAREAPGVCLRVAAHTPEVVAQAMETLRTTDGLLLPHGYIRDVPNIDLFEDDWVAVVSADNASIGETLTMDHLATLPWVMTYLRPTAFTPAEQHLRMMGIEARASVVVESFLTIPFFVAGTNRIAMLQRRLARHLETFADVRLLDLPFDAMPIVEAFWWHPVHRSDPAHRWLRHTLREVAREIRGPASPPGQPTAGAASGDA
jgi:DNA-binding transcriptional LysR family regulator